MISYDVKKVGQDIVTVSIGLFRIMIPTIIAVKIAQEVGFDDVLIWAFAPLMGMMDLPAAMAVILVTTLLTNPYAGLIVATAVPEVAGLSVGQTSIIALFMLFTHGLPLEAMVSRRVGVKLWFVVVIRLLAGFLSGILLAHLFAITGWFQQDAPLSLLQFVGQDEVFSTSLLAWVQGQIIALIIIQLVIIGLVALLELLRIIGVERFMTWLLSPMLRFMGIGKRASTIAIVGVMLGLSFGSGVLMKDVATGTIAKRDVFGVVCFINLFHSAFEDTAVVMLLGPSLIIILGARFIVSVVMTIAVMAIAARLDDAQMKRYFTNHYIPDEAG